MVSPLGHTLYDALQRRRPINAVRQLLPLVHVAQVKEGAVLEPEILAALWPMLPEYP